MSYHKQWSCGHEWDGKSGRFPVPATLYIYIFILPPLGAYKSQLGGQCLLWLYVYIYAYIYIIFINIHFSCQLIVGVFARQMHSTSEFAMTVLSKCAIHAGFVTVAWTLRGIPFQVGEWILDLIAEITFFNLVIRLSKVKQSAIFQLLTRRSLFNSLPRCLALTFSLIDICLHSWKPRQPSFPLCSRV